MIDLAKKSAIEKAIASMIGLLIGRVEAQASAKKAEEQQRKMETRKMEWLMARQNG